MVHTIDPSTPEAVHLGEFEASPADTLRVRQPELQNLKQQQESKKQLGKKNCSKVNTQIIKKHMKTYSTPLLDQKHMRYTRGMNE